MKIRGVRFSEVLHTSKFKVYQGVGFFIFILSTTFLTSSSYSKFMPSFKTHCAISKKRTGQDFAELHKWIDNPTKELGVDHRIKRHSFNENEKNRIKEYWDSKGCGLGEKAVVEWLFHIAIDNLHTAFKMSKKSSCYGSHTYNLMEIGLSKNNFIHCNFDRVNDYDLDSIFEEEPVEEYY